MRCTCWSWTFIFTGWNRWRSPKLQSEERDFLPSWQANCNGYVWWWCGSILGSYQPLRRTLDKLQLNCSSVGNESVLLQRQSISDEKLFGMVVLPNRYAHLSFMKSSDWSASRMLESSTFGAWPFLFISFASLARTALNVGVTGVYFHIELCRQKAQWQTPIYSRHANVQSVDV